MSERTTRRFGSGQVARAAALTLWVGAVCAFGGGCDRGRERAVVEAPAGAEPVVLDRYADGAELATRKARWSKSWGAQTATLAPCADVSAAEAAKCALAQEALSRLSRLELAGAPDAEIMAAARELAVAGDGAVAVLRSRRVEWLLTPEGASDALRASGGAKAAVSELTPTKAEGASANGAGGGATGPGVAAAASERGGVARGAERSKPEAAPGPGVQLRGATDGDAAGPGEEGEHPEHGAEPREQGPWADLIREYEAATRVGYGRLAGYLRVGPEATRRAVLEQLRQLAEAGTPSPRLERVLVEAALLERDAGMRAQVSALRERVSQSRAARARAQAPAGPAVPGGHAGAAGRANPPATAAPQP